MSPVSAPSLPSPPTSFEPYIPEDTSLREFTVRSVLLGTLLGLVFGASSLYLVLKVGLTVSASIPVAVISITLFKLWARLGGRDATILEHNITQTAGSAGESIAFGVGVTMPAILILGFDLDLIRVTTVSILGALLGVLMMIPLRRALIVREHGVLKYPEGTACAQVLKAGASAESRSAASPSAQAEYRKAIAAGLGHNLHARTIFTGFGIGLAYKTVMVAFHGWRESVGHVFGDRFRGASVATEVSPELLGVGYIIGPRIASIMVAGGVLAYLVLIPLIMFFGQSLPHSLSPANQPIAQLDPDGIRDAYILYIGAGAVAAGGIFSLIRSLPTIWSGIRLSFGEVRAANAGVTTRIRRTDRDLSGKVVVAGLMILLALILLGPGLNMNLLGAMLLVIFGFIFVTVSSRLTGELGSSSNPVSGMTVATLLFTCLVFVILGWTGEQYFVTALCIGGIVCIAASTGGATSQDLKTGYLVGGTPRLQQIAMLGGALASALVLGPILKVLNDQGTVYVPAATIAPGLRIDPRELGRSESQRGPHANDELRSYRVWHNLDPDRAPEGRYLANDDGTLVWFVDPGINGSVKETPDGAPVTKFSAPKATLMSYIIRGILDRRLPWALVLLGIMISVTLELCGVSSLAFAVGVYLPLSASAPIFIGGAIRWFVDRYRRRQPEQAQLTEPEFAAESDKSPGVLLASGYIAGGAIAGIVIAFMGGVLVETASTLQSWATNHNPFYSTAEWNRGRANLLSLLPFAALIVLLYLVGRKTSRPSSDRG